MNVGLYSLKTMELKENSILITDIRFIPGVEQIFLYSENTEKEKRAKRVVFRKMLEDYKKRKIELIVFKNLAAIGKDKYERCQILKELLLNDYKFCTIEENHNNLNDFGKIFTKNLIEESEKEKKYKDTRNKMILTKGK